MKTQRIAAIDIGSNSLKLAVVAAAASDSFTIIWQDRERVRLGHGTLQNRTLSAKAIDLSAEAIGRFRSIAETREVGTIIAVATASLREALNAEEFVEEIKKRTNVNIEVLPSIEEARLIGISATTYFGSEYQRLLNIDIGGGSTEVSLMEDGEPKKLFSMKLGAVGLTEKFFKNNPPTQTELERVRKEIAFALAKPARKLMNEKWDIASGTSGTALNFSSLIGFEESGEELPGAEIELSKLSLLTKRFSKMSLEERMQLPVISERRAEVIVAGGLILEGIMKRLGIKTLVPCTYALREGVVIDHLQEVETESLPPVPDVEDRKLRDVFAIGRRFGYEESHAVQVASMAESIFDELAPIYQLPRHQRTLLSAAALLHDVGYHISHESHHKHSLYLIKYSEMTGFSEAEKAIIANIARYHRKAFPKSTHPDYMSLGKAGKKIVNRMSSILRIADGLDRDYESRVQSIKFEKGKKELTLKLISNEDIENEIYAIKMKKDFFENVFKTKLRVVQVKATL